MDRKKDHDRGGESRAAGASGGEVTRILADLRHGDGSARERLVALVYADLRKLAAMHLRRERKEHTLQPTALVHEAFLRLFGSAGAAWENRAHFFGAAGEAMRRILVDVARRRKAVKRGGGDPPDTPVEARDAEDHMTTILAVDQALTRLAVEDNRKRRLVELRFFAGLTLEEAAETLGISQVTAKRDWAFAKAWLRRELGPARATEEGIDERPRD